MSGVNGKYPVNSHCNMVFHKILLLKEQERLVCLTIVCNKREISIFDI